jgi:hypothetical protein
LTPAQAQALICVDRAVLRAAAVQLARHGPMRTRQWLDRDHPPELSLAILDCLASQRDHAHKFEQPERWLLTRQAAEQATSWRLACWRADYLRSRFPNQPRLLELGSGVGGDAVYLACRFQLISYEQDEARAILARANLAELAPQAENPRLETRRVEPAELQDGLLFVDPARRDQTRQFDPEQWSPPLSQLLALSRPMALKTAPGLDLALLPEDVEVHFLSLSGELKEALLLRRPEQANPTRHAWLWPKGAPQPLHRQGESAPPPARQPVVGEYLHNPDPALVRAGLLGGLAQELGGGLVHPMIAYLCGPRPCPDAWAVSFRIVDTFGLNWKRLEEALAATDWSDFEYLARGVPFSQDEVLRRTRRVRKQMPGRTGGRGAVVVYRVDSGYQVLLAQRCASTSTASEGGGRRTAPAAVERPGL